LKVTFPVRPCAYDVRNPATACVTVCEHDDADTFGWHGHETGPPSRIGTIVPNHRQQVKYREHLVSKTVFTTGFFGGGKSSN
jgi:hypothetical protein